MLLFDNLLTRNSLPFLQAIAFLESDELEAEVNKVADAARAKGITGVPVTVIDGKWAVSGGQSSDVFVQVCRRCWSRQPSY